MNFFEIIGPLVYIDPLLFQKNFYIIMLTFWVFFVQIARMVARYGKIIVPQYLNFHAIMMTMLSMFTILYVSIYFSLFGLKMSTTIDIAKTALTFILLVLLIIQIFLGTFSRVFMLSDGYIKSHLNVKLAHKWLGYFMILLGRIIISIYFVQQSRNATLSSPQQISAQQQRLKAWFFVVGTLYFFIILFEFMYRSLIPIFVKRRLQKSINTIPPQFQVQSPYYQIAKLVKQGIQQQIIFSRYPQCRWVIFNNRLYDIQNFKHPGGENIIYQIMGRQINYFIYGGHFTINNPLKHKHSIYVQRYFKNKQSILIQPEPLILKNNFLEDEQQRRFRIKNVKVFKESQTATIEFGSLNTSLKNFYEGIEEFGKYFILEAFTQNHETIKRPYSIILCETQDNKKFRQHLKQLCQNMKTINLIEGVNFKKSCDFIPLMVKYCPGGSLSGIIKNIPHTDYKITGPFGKGLGLKQDELGHIVIITGGTGILPFLDLFDYLYRFLAFKMLSEQFGTHQVERLNPYNIKYYMFKNLSIKLYASFKNKNQFYGQQIIHNLHSLSKLFNKSIFDLQLRFSDNDYHKQGLKIRRDHLGQTTIRQIIKSCPNRVFVCGTPKMNQQIQTLFIQNGGIPDLLYFP